MVLEMSTLALAEASLVALKGDGGGFCGPNLDAVHLEEVIEQHESVSATTWASYLGECTI